MVEEIITALSRFKSLFVIARNSSFTFKGKAVDVKEVGRRLGVRYVLEGSILPPLSPPSCSKSPDRLCRRRVRRRRASGTARDGNRGLCQKRISRESHNRVRDRQRVECLRL